MNGVHLRDLEIGDHFYPASAAKSGRATDIFEVVGKNEFNIRHGSATRMCKNTRTGDITSHSGRKQVIISNRHKKTYDN